MRCDYLMHTVVRYAICVGWIGMFVYASGLCGQCDAWRLEPFGFEVWGRVCSDAKARYGDVIFDGNGAAAVVGFQRDRN